MGILWLEWLHRYTEIVPSPLLHVSVSDWNFKILFLYTIISCKLLSNMNIYENMNIIYLLISFQAW